jgi:molecular chaperone GrpE
VTVISPEGEPFDPEFHEAMTMQESDTAEPDTVLTVVQRGYRLNGRLLRPARVIVAKEPG